MLWARADDTMADVLSALDRVYLGGGGAHANGSDGCGSVGLHSEARWQRCAGRGRSHAAHATRTIATCQTALAFQEPCAAWD